MDVGIRAANILSALDLVIGAGLDPGQDVIDIVLRAAREHADHIATHLEWSESGRSNHYLANLVGLLWAASYLPSDLQTDGWLGTASAELLQEADRQFLPDGGNYEGSTNYHRLSGELVLFGIALLVGLGKRDVARLGGAAVPAPLCDKLFRAAELTRAITRPDRRVVQFGDTDSGRVFKLTPVGRTETTAKGAEVREDALDHRTFVDGVGALFGIGSARTLDAVVVGRLAAGRTFAGPRQAEVADHGDLDAAIAKIEALPAIAVGSDISRLHLQHRTLRGDVQLFPISASTSFLRQVLSSHSVARRDRRQAPRSVTPTTTISPSNTCSAANAESIRDRYAIRLRECCVIAIAKRPRMTCPVQSVGMSPRRERTCLRSNTWLGRVAWLGSRMVLPVRSLRRAA